MELRYGREGQARAGQGPTAGPQVISCRFPPRGSPTWTINVVLQRRFELCRPPRPTPTPKDADSVSAAVIAKLPLLAKVQ